MKNKLDSLSFVIGNTSFTLHPEAYLVSSESLTDGNLYGYCYIDVIALPKTVGSSQILIGQTFLHNFYSVYNYTSGQVSLAVNAHSSEIATSEFYVQKST